MMTMMTASNRGNNLFLFLRNLWRLRRRLWPRWKKGHEKDTEDIPQNYYDRLHHETAPSTETVVTVLLPELMMRIASFVDLPTLVTLRKVNYFMKDIFEKELFHRMEHRPMIANADSTSDDRNDMETTKTSSLKLRFKHDDGAGCVQALVSAKLRYIVVEENDHKNPYHHLSAKDWHTSHREWLHERALKLHCNPSSFAQNEHVSLPDDYEYDEEKAKTMLSDDKAVYSVHFYQSHGYDVGSHNPKVQCFIAGLANFEDYPIGYWSCRALSGSYDRSLTIQPVPDSIRQILKSFITTTTKHTTTTTTTDEEVSFTTTTTNNNNLVAAFLYCDKYSHYKVKTIKNNGRAAVNVVRFAQILPPPEGPKRTVSTELSELCEVVDDNYKKDTVDTTTTRTSKQRRCFLELTMRITFDE